MTYLLACGPPIKVGLRHIKQAQVDNIQSYVLQLHSVFADIPS